MSCRTRCGSRPFIWVRHMPVVGKYVRTDFRNVGLSLKMSGLIFKKSSTVQTRPNSVIMKPTFIWRSRTAEIIGYVLCHRGVESNSDISDCGYASWLRFTPARTRAKRRWLSCYAPGLMKRWASTLQTRVEINFGRGGLWLWWHSTDHILSDFNHGLLSCCVLYAHHRLTTPFTSNHHGMHPVTKLAPAAPIVWRIEQTTAAQDKHHRKMLLQQ